MSAAAKLRGWWGVIYRMDDVWLVKGELEGRGRVVLDTLRAKARRVRASGRGPKTPSSKLQIGERSSEPR